MKRSLTSLLVATAFALVPLLAGAADKDKKKDDAKPYPLDTCVVSGEKIGADPAMKPYTFVEKGQEVKLCCKACLSDFKKDKAKHLARIEAAQKKTK